MNRRRVVAPWVVLAISTVIAAAELFRDDVRVGLLGFALALMVFALGDLRRELGGTPGDQP